MNFSLAWIVYFIAGLLGLMLAGELIHVALFTPTLENILFFGGGSSLFLVSIANFYIAFAFSLGKLSSVHGELDAADLIRDGEVVKTHVNVRWIRYFNWTEAIDGRGGRVVFFFSGWRAWSCREDDFFANKQ